jgi:hypothetical protein
MTDVSGQRTDREAFRVQYESKDEGRGTGDESYYGSWEMD